LNPAEGGKKSQNRNIRAIEQNAPAQADPNNPVPSSIEPRAAEVKLHSFMPRIKGVDMNDLRSKG
jgi:hypothetical protein